MRLQVADGCVLFSKPEELIDGLLHARKEGDVNGG